MSKKNEIDMKITALLRGDAVVIFNNRDERIKIENLLRSRGRIFIGERVDKGFIGKMIFSNEFSLRFSFSEMIVFEIDELLYSAYDEIKVMSFNEKMNKILSGEVSIWFKSRVELDILKRKFKKIGRNIDNIYGAYEREGYISKNKFDLDFVIKPRNRINTPVLELKDLENIEMIDFQIYPYKITMKNGEIKVGCQTRTLEQWENVTKIELSFLDHTTNAIIYYSEHFEDFKCIYKAAFIDKNLKVAILEIIIHGVHTKQRVFVTSKEHFYNVRYKNENFIGRLISFEEIEYYPEIIGVRLFGRPVLKLGYASYHSQDCMKFATARTEEKESKSYYPAVTLTVNKKTRKLEYEFIDYEDKTMNFNISKFTSRIIFTKKIPDDFLKDVESRLADRISKDFRVHKTTTGIFRATLNKEIFITTIEEVRKTSKDIFLLQKLIIDFLKEEEEESKRIHSFPDTVTFKSEK